MKTYLQMDGDQLVEYVEKREYDLLALALHDMESLLESEKSTRNAIIKLGAELERDLVVTRNQLDRICEEGFNSDDTIGLEPADDYILRKLAELKQALNQQLQDAVEALKLSAAVIGSPNDGEWKSVDECNAAFNAATEVIRAAKGEQP